MISTDDQVPTPEPLSLEDDPAASGQEPVADEEEKEDDEDEEGEGGEGGKKSGGGGKKPGVDVKLDEKLLSEEDLSQYDSESLIEKLKLLAWSPMSALVSGASAFDSESDLRRKLFLGEVGLMTNEIQPHDIADPDLIAKLEKRNQERQEMIRVEKAQMLTAAAGTAAVAGGLAALPEIPDPVPKVERPKEPSNDARKEAEMVLKAEGAARKQEEQKLRTEEEYKSQAKPVDYSADIKKEDPGIKPYELMEMLPEHSFAENIDPTPNTGQAAQSPTGIEKLAGFFNAIAQVTEMAQPAQKTDFKLPDPAPKVDIGPMGGV